MVPFVGGGSRFVRIVGLKVIIAFFFGLGFDSDLFHHSLTWILLVSHKGVYNSRVGF